MKKIAFLCILQCVTLAVFAQRERGNIISAPKIYQKKSEAVEQSKRQSSTFQDEVDFQFEEEPRLRFQSSFEAKETTPKESSNLIGNETGVSSPIKLFPNKSINETTQDDTSSIDEGSVMVVEIEEEARFPGSAEMVKIASYFSIWDNHYVNPYGINPKDFNEIVPIKLYDISKGRYWAQPLDHCPVTSHFGYRWRRWHKGTDIDLETGDPVYAAFDGIIRVSGTKGGFGRCVVIRHYNGLETVYGHMSKLHFPENTRVNAGDEIGLGGNTGRSYGSHLHFETRYEGNPFDAENIFKFTRDTTTIKMQEFLMTSKLYDYLRGKSPRVDVTEVDPSISPAEILNGSEDLEGDLDEEMPEEVIQKAWYRVRPGDNLTKIARSYGTSVTELCNLNKISSYKKLSVGMRLRVK
ncbi:peptidoglycan DD-metalloendopeptidase family protein [Marinilongibacter aquaticus]|uniref:M23 family metallopeptidase n=1 Tax=Marinilongibacter aquaticus TaxID=2975157 RepID=UPI0021BDB222|nr:M23 family metallopeptidase [Marinilongibacter aquaticus]UBM58901.1 peptidoglycan DD-metalloendopeptidase family protein [Marinilongibacter aquaticus]